MLLPSPLLPPPLSGTPFPHHGSFPKTAHEEPHTHPQATEQHPLTTLGHLQMLLRYTLQGLPLHLQEGPWDSHHVGPSAPDSQGCVQMQHSQCKSTVLPQLVHGVCVCAHWSSGPNKQGQSLWLLKSNEVGAITYVPQRCHSVLWGCPPAAVQARMANAPKGESPCFIGC